MPKPPKVRVIADILEEHLEELVFLWQQRNEAVRSPDYNLSQMDQLDERIEAHVQGLLVGGEAVLPLLEEGLAADDPNEVLAAAYALLRLDTEPAAQRVAAAWADATEVQRDGIGQALSHGPITRLQHMLQDTVTAGPASLAVSAAQALAAQGCLDTDHPRLPQFVSDDDPIVRQTAWRVFALLGAFPK